MIGMASASHVMSGMKTLAPADWWREERECVCWPKLRFHFTILPILYLGIVGRAYEGAQGVKGEISDEYIALCHKSTRHLH